MTSSISTNSHALHAQLHRLTACSVLVFTSFGAMASSATDSAVAQSYAADAAYGMRDFTSASAAVNQAMQLLPTSASAVASGTSVACPAGGSITYGMSTSSASAASAALPIYTVQFQQCALTGGIVINGSFVKSVISMVVTAPSASNGWVVTTTDDAISRFNQITVTLPAGSTTLNGSSETKSKSSRNLYTKATSNTVEHLISSGNAITLSTSHVFNERSSSYALTSGTDVTYSSMGIGGSTTQTSLSGKVNLTVYPYQLAQVGLIDQLSFALTFTDTLNFDASGIVNSGAFKLVTPVNNAYLVTAGGGQLTVCLDLGNDGATDMCWGPFACSAMTQ
jgi:hypothetical protein